MKDVDTEVPALTKSHKSEQENSVYPVTLKQ